MVKHQIPVTCYDCAGIEHCHGSKQPGIPREAARETAAACDSLHKGRTVEVVSVVGRERGISRKNAEELVARKKAVWEAHRLVRILESPPGPQDGGAS